MSSSQYSTFIQKIEAIIHSNLENNEFDVQALAENLFISRVQLYRKLVKITGFSPTTFIRQYRLREGKELLGNSQLQIKEIAYKVGFKDPAHFTNAFRAYYGVTPSEERR